MEPERISFPTEYPIKVLARAAPGLRELLDAVFARHFGATASGTASERTSANNNFVALTYVPIVQDAAQLQALHQDLRQIDGVVMVL